MLSNLTDCPSRPSFSVSILFLAFDFLQFKNEYMYVVKKKKVIKTKTSNGKEHHESKFSSHTSMPDVTATVVYPSPNFLCETDVRVLCVLFDTLS